MCAVERLWALPGKLLLALALSLSSPEPAIASARHLEQADCATCHLAGSATRSENAQLLLGTQKQLCTACHEKSVRLSHRNGFPAKAYAPGVFPLDWKGELVCSTCHLIHAPLDKMLRGGKRGKEFCLGCHRPQFFSELAAGGARTPGRSRDGVRYEALGEELDDGSLACVKCHMTQPGRLEVWVDPALVVRHGTDSPYDHPLGRIETPNPVLGTHLLGRAGKVQFVQNAMSCLSCHDQGGKPHGKPLPTINKEGLCRECHEFKS